MKFLSLPGPTFGGEPSQATLTEGISFVFGRTRPKCLEGEAVFDFHGFATVSTPRQKVGEPVDVRRHGLGLLRSAAISFAAAFDE